METNLNETQLSEETKKYVQRTVERLKAIYQTPAPWTIRDQVGELISKLEVLVPENDDKS